MNLSKWTRQLHRWISVIFVATVAANFLVMAVMEPPLWVSLLPLLPLLLLTLTGLYLFGLPYVVKARRRGQAGA